VKTHIFILFSVSTHLQLIQLHRPGLPYINYMKYITECALHMSTYPHYTLLVYSIHSFIHKVVGLPSCTSVRSLTTAARHAA